MQGFGCRCNTTDTLHPGEGNYYKVTVPADVDLSIALTTNLSATGSNSLHVAYNRIPSDLNLISAGTTRHRLNQQALVSILWPYLLY